MAMPPSIPTAAEDPPRFSEDIDSTCSTPFVSAPSSPGHGPSGYFFSAPASPMHFLLTSTPDYDAVILSSDSASIEFEFSSRFSPNGYGGIASSMTSADELFFNGQIRPAKLSSHLASPQDAPLMDLETGATSRGRDLRLRSTKLASRRARSMSPLRFDQWRGGGGGGDERGIEERENDPGETTPSCSASSSRSSSSGSNSRKWIFLKEFLNRSKSEGRANSKEKKTPSELSPSSSRDENKNKKKKESKAASGVWRRRAALSAHEVHYTAKRAQAEEMKKRTFLPYRQGVLGCLGFSSKSYGAFSGFTRNLNPMSSR